MNTPVAIGIACLLGNLTTAGYVHYRLRTANIAAPIANVAEVKVINGREPVLQTVKILSSRSYAGEQLSSSFTQSIRDNSYLVESEGHRYVFYSPHFQSLDTDTVIRGWFVHWNIRDQTVEGQPTFISPIEIIEIKMPPLHLANP